MIFKVSNHSVILYLVSVTFTKPSSNSQNYYYILFFCLVYNMIHIYILQLSLRNSRGLTTFAATEWFLLEDDSCHHFGDS